MKTSNADAWFSKFIRLRDADENGLCHCITCGHIADPKAMDCGHWQKRQYMSTRFSEVNCASQCGKCNRFEQGNDVKFRAALVQKYGEDRIQILETLHKTTRKISNFELEQIAKYYKEKAKELAKEKHIKIW